MPPTGESWSFALALRLASYDLLRADGDDPILILDDVFAELDTRAPRTARRAGGRGRAGAGHRRGRRRRARSAARAADRRRRRAGRGPCRVTSPTSRPPASPGRRTSRRTSAWPSPRRRTPTTTPGSTWPAASPAGWPAPGARRKRRFVLRVRAAVPGGPTRSASGAHPDERDPQLLDTTIGRLIADQGWSTDVRVHGVFTRWEQLVGREVAQHCRPRRSVRGRSRQRRHPRGAHRLHRLGHPDEAARADRRTPAQRGARRPAR